MLQSISWGQYISVLLFLLVCYYFFIGYRYYRWEILGLIGIKKMERDEPVVHTVANLKKAFEVEDHEDYLPRQSADIDISPLVQSFTDEVKAYILAASKSVIKEELSYALQVIIRKYPALQNADCKDEMVQFILTETNSKYPKLLEPVDANRLWL